jgi:hypothetical protein
LNSDKAARKRTKRRTETMNTTQIMFHLKMSSQTTMSTMRKRTICQRRKRRL